MARASRLVVAVALVLATAGCVRVAVYDRELLAKPTMQVPAHRSIDGRDQHMFEVREASRGADGPAGGGCGCN
jgi:hypothetical protein